MSGSYSAFASMTVRSNAPEVLERIGRGLTRLDGRIKATENSLASLLGRFSALNGAERAFDRLGVGVRNLATYTQDATRASMDQARAFDRSAQSAERAVQAHQRLAQALRSVSIAPVGSGGGGGYTGPARPYGVGQRTPVGVRGDRLGEMAALGMAARSGQQGLGRVARDAGALQNEQGILAAQTGRMRPDQGMDAAAFQRDLLARAIETTRLVPGTTIEQNFAAGAELRNVLAGPRNAVRFLPQMQMIVTALARASGGNPDGMAQSLGKALSLRGSFNNQMTGEADPERGLREMQHAGQMMFAFRGRGVNPHELEMFQRNARVMGERMAPEAYFGGWTASMIQNLGGQRAGTAINAFGRQMVNGIMPNSQAEFLKEHGLIAPNARGARIPEREIRGMLQRQEIDEEEAGRMRSGATSRFNARHIVNSDMAALRPDLFFDWLVQHLATRGIRTQDERDAFANRAGSTNTGRQAWSFGLNPAAVRPDIAAVQSVDWEMVEKFVSSGYAGALGNMLAGITNATAQMGASSTEDIVKLMNSIASGLNSLGEWASKNPEQSAMLLNVAAGLTAVATAGALFAAGSLAFTGLAGLAGVIGSGVGLAGVVATGAFAALISPLGLAGLAAGIGVLAFSMEGKDWKALFDGVTTGLKGMWDAIRNQAGLGPNGAAGATGPTIVPGVGVAPNISRPPGSMPGLMPGLPNLVLPPGLRRNSSFEGGGEEAGKTVVVQLMLDGRKVGEGVMPWIERAVSGPVQAAARFDGRRGLTSVDTA